MTEPASDRFSRLAVAEALALVAAGRGVLADARDRRLYDNAHAEGALSLPLAELEGPEGRARAEAGAAGRVLILYCA
ncbi:MAG TPA: hypothetical protein VNI61_10860 [Gemmatimonadales bacterium]|nr:hypothetical protein [Gemmatimonadales bacterium]